MGGQTHLINRTEEVPQEAKDRGRMNNVSDGRHLKRAVYSSVYLFRCLAPLCEKVSLHACKKPKENVQTSFCCRNTEEEVVC